MTEQKNQDQIRKEIREILEKMDGIEDIISEIEVRYQKQVAPLVEKIKPTQIEIDKLSVSLSAETKPHIQVYGVLDKKVRSLCLDLEKSVSGTRRTVVYSRGKESVDLDKLTEWIAVHPEHAKEFEEIVVRKPSVSIRRK